MQVEQAERIRRQWEAKGNLPCNHPAVESEHYLGADTGDDVCTTCDRAAMRGILQQGT